MAIGTDDTIEGLDTTEYCDHHRRERRLERLGWFVMATVIVLALLGGLGPGPLSWEQIETADHALSVEYASVVHHEAPAELVLRIRPAAGASSVRLGVSRSLCDHVTLESIVPRPLEEQGRADDVVYTFAVDSTQSSTVLFRFSYDDFGPFEHHISIDGGEALEFHQRVLP